MSMDPIANMLTIIRNGQASRLGYVRVPLSKFKVSIVEYLQKNGYIDSYTIQNRDIVVKLKYLSDQPKIREIERISHVGSRIYSRSSALNSRTRKVGHYILTTSRGLMDAIEARKKGLGGEIIMRIW